MCKYCEGLKINPNTLGGEQEPLYEDQNIILQVAQDTPIGRRHGGSCMDILVGKEIKHIQIFYCPMCGRRLNYIPSEGIEKSRESRKTSDDWKEEFGGPLPAIKYFFDRLNNLDEYKRGEIRREMRYVGDSKLKFIKDMYDSNRLTELDERLKEKEGKI